MDILLKSLDIIIEDQLWPERKASDIFRILMYVHNKGWLYTPMNDGIIQTVICAYRISEVTDDSLVKLPVEESGKILYIPFVISTNKKDNIYRTVRSSLKKYLEDNNDIEELVLEDKNQKIKRYKIKGESNGKGQIATAPSSTNVSN